MPLFGIPEHTSCDIRCSIDVLRAIYPILLVIFINFLQSTAIAYLFHTIDLHHMSIKAYYLCFIWKTHFQSKRNLGDTDTLASCIEAVSKSSPSLISTTMKIAGVGHKIAGEVPDVFRADIVHTASCVNQQLAKCLFVICPLFDILDSIVATDVTFPSGVDGSVCEKPTAENIHGVGWLDRLPVIGVSGNLVRGHRGEDGFKCRGVHTIIEHIARFLR